MDWDLGLIVLGVTGVFKEFGVRGKWLTLTALLVGMAVSVFWELLPEAALITFNAIVLGLTASGLYGIAQAGGQGIIRRLKGFGK